MRDISINITKARIKSFSVELEDEKPVITASIALLTAGNEAIATYTISTASWTQESRRFSVNPGMVDSLLTMAHELEQVVTENCKQRQIFIEGR